MISSPRLQAVSTILCTELVVPPTIRKACAAPNASAASSSASRMTETGCHRLSHAPKVFQCFMNRSPALIHMGMLLAHIPFLPLLSKVSQSVLSPDKFSRIHKKQAAHLHNLFIFSISLSVLAGCIQKLCFLPLIFHCFFAFILKRLSHILSLKIDLF